MNRTEAHLDDAALERYAQAIALEYPAPLDASLHLADCSACRQQAMTRVFDLSIFRAGLENPANLALIADSLMNNSAPPVAGSASPLETWDSLTYTFKDRQGIIRDLTDVARQYDVSFTAMKAHMADPPGSAKLSFSCTAFRDDLASFKRDLPRHIRKIEAVQPGAADEPANSGPVRWIAVRGTDRDNVVVELVQIITHRLQVPIRAFEARTYPSRNALDRTELRLLCCVAPHPDCLDDFHNTLNTWSHRHGYRTTVTTHEPEEFFNPADEHDAV